MTIRPPLVPLDSLSRGEHFPHFDFGFHQLQRLGSFLSRGTSPPPIRRHRSPSRSRTTAIRLVSSARIERDNSQLFPSSHCVDLEILKRRLLSIRSPPSVGRRLPEYHRRTRLPMADQPIRAPTTNGASTLMETLVANSDESTSNSDESTQKMQKETEQLKSTPLIKSFGEAVANSAGNRSLHQHPSDLRKFFLADQNPQPLGRKSVNQGRPTLSFADAETEELEAPYPFSLVGKFSHGAPPHSQMHQLIARLGIRGAFTVSMINSKHTLISLSSESDYSRLWLRRIWFLQGFPMRIFKWTPTFTPTQESSIIPIWVCFPKLPAHLFRKETLFSVASMVSSSLQIDALTLNKSKLSQARVCVEIDLLRLIIEEFDLHINGVTIVQKVVFEHLPEYCSLCKHVGHKDSDSFSKGNAPRPPPRNKIKPRQLQFAGTERTQARDRGKKMTVPIGCPAAKPNEEAEHSIADQPEKGDKDQQENDNQVEQIQSHGKQGNLKMDITGTPNSENYQGAAIHGCTSHTNLTPQGDNCIDNMDNSNLVDPLIAELLDRDGNAENHDFSSTSKSKTRGKAKKTPKSGGKGCTSTKATRTRILLREECSNQKQRNEFLSEMDIIEIQATQETSESEAQDTNENSDKEEAVTPTYNRFQSLDDSDSLLELDAELHPQVQASEQEIANDIALESNLQEHILEDSTMSNKLKRNNSMEHNPHKTGKGGGKGKKNKGNSTTRTLHKRNTRNPRRALWEELKRLSLNKVPLIVGGDFNTMLHTHENQGGTISSLGAIEDFNDMVLDSGLIDAGFEGEPFTWTNKRVWRRLDRVLYSQEWTELFNSTRVSHLPRRLSDHHPLLITATRTEDKVPSSFRFQHMWIMHHNFQDMVKQSWGAPIHGYGMYRLQQKLYRLKDHLKQWNKDKFGNIFSLVDQAKAAANEAEKQFDRLPSEANLINLNRQNAALIHALNLESEFWRQKNNCKWLEAGERNTKFFHASVKKKRLKSRISKVMDYQQEITDSAQIKDSAAHFFESLLSDIPTTALPHDFPFQFPQIHQDVLLNLYQPPSQDDIRDVVFSINKDSAAGPDGFSSAFFQSCWNTIAEDNTAAVMDFFRGTHMPRSFSATTIILIPKNDSPQSWSEFRPISLCNVTNTILSKLLYTKISQALPDLISPSQSGFVPGRLIADNILLAQEMTHHLDMSHSKGNLILKLDMSKAYDRVNWKFLYLVLEKMGFPPRFIVLIKHAIEHCWFTILVNGEPYGFFKSSQGLRQGDPISPTLFILVVEALSRGLNHLFYLNPDMFYQTGCKSRVSHLAYADDIIIFTRLHSLTKLMQFLELYEDQSGQKINHSKSFFIPGKKANHIAHRIKSITGFNLKCLPITYLGAPLHKDGLSSATLVKKGVWVSETLGIISQPLPINSGGG
ncbi:UNVERIFIED_CONTAM: hypothetical protein Sindi_2681000 [Sesamum indicum]